MVGGGGLVVDGPLQLHDHVGLQYAQRQGDQDAAGHGVVLLFVWLGAHRGERPQGRGPRAIPKFPATPRLPTSATQSPARHQLLSHGQDSVNLSCGPCSGGNLSSVKDLWLLHAPSFNQTAAPGLNRHNKSSITASTSPRKDQLRLQICKPEKQGANLSVLPRRYLVKPSFNQHQSAPVDVHVHAQRVGHIRYQNDLAQRELGAVPGLCFGP
jgi:hypothetical protein